MEDITIPLLVISEKTTWGELPDVLEEVWAELERTHRESAPVLMLEPRALSRNPAARPGPAEAPDELVVIAYHPVVRRTIFAALERVRLREPKLAPAEPHQLPRFNNKTPLKSFFRQMRAIPVTVFSVTFPDNGPNAVSVFFLGSPFTVSEFRRELAARPLDDPGDDAGGGFSKS